MAETVKITKAQYFESIKAVAETMNFGEISGADMVAFCDAQLEQLANKAAKAKEKAAEKKAATDELKAVVASILTEELQTADEILAQIESDDEISKAKVVSRLTALVKDGVATKEEVKVEKSKKMAYKLA